MTVDNRPQTHQHGSGQAANGRLQSSAVRDRRAFKLRFVIPLVIIGAVAALVLGRSLWLPVIGRFLVVADPIQACDALVVLGGGRRERVEHGAMLFKSGYARWFIVTNSPLELPGVRADYAELMRTEAVWQGVPEDRVLTAPGIAETTYQEALAVRQLVQERGLRCVTIVTDPYHTRRARTVFQDAFRGSGVTVLVQPVNASWYQADFWWRDRVSVRVTWTEYVALILYLVGYR
jgi:uncharacterized SAM-binding protein YcdF (DUF218 family)